jgi:hypothetical protein
MVVQKIADVFQPSDAGDEEGRENRDAKLLAGNLRPSGSAQRRLCRHFNQ